VLGIAVADVDSGGCSFQIDSPGEGTLARALPAPIDSNVVILPSGSRTKP